MRIVPVVPTLGICDGASKPRWVKASSPENQNHKTMKHAIYTALLAAAFIVASLPTFGAVQLRVSDGTPAGTVLITDQDPNDENPQLGVVAYNGPVGTNWLFNNTS